jgi:hypothetical protein
LRGQDLNLRPLGYEPNELPDCSTPRREVLTAPEIHETSRALAVKTVRASARRYQERVLARRSPDGLRRSLARNLIVTRADKEGQRNVIASSSRNSSQTTARHSTLPRRADSPPSLATGVSMRSQRQYPSENHSGWFG